MELDFMGIKGYGEVPAIAYYNIPVEKTAEDIAKGVRFDLGKILFIGVSGLGIEII